MYLLHNYNLIISLILLCIALCEACPREMSRVVRKRIAKVMQPIYDEYATMMDPQCPLHQSHDRYSAQEIYKVEETPSRWRCDYCGKSFYGEPFIDLHMDNRHEDKMNSDESSICFADWCDVFRCEVLTSTGSFTFWNQALCKEKRMIQLKAKCQNLVKMCMPEGVEHKELQDLLEDAVCSYLTCENYSDKSDTEYNSAPTVLYTIAAIFQIFFCVIYYVIAYTHFYEEPLLDSHHMYEEELDTDLIRNDNSGLPPGRLRPGDVGVRRSRVTSRS